MELLKNSYSRHNDEAIENKISKKYRSLKYLYTLWVYKSMCLLIHFLLASLPWQQQYKNYPAKKLWEWTGHSTLFFVVMILWSWSTSRRFQPRLLIKSIYICLLPSGSFIRDKAWSNHSVFSFYCLHQILGLWYYYFFLIAFILSSVVFLVDSFVYFSR